MQPRVLLVCGTARPDERLERVMDVVQGAVVDGGGLPERLDLHTLALPIMRYGDAAQDQMPEVQRVRRTAAEADAFVLGTPEYHGTMSGALKNWFDFLYAELAGKLAGVVATTGGGTGDLSITAVKRTFAWCHGFTLPFHAAADRSTFEDGELTDPKVRERLQRIGHDVVRYARVLRPAWEEAREDTSARGGVAGLHPKLKP